MKNPLQTKVVRSLFFIGVCLLISPKLHAQYSLYGPSTANVGESKLYSILYPPSGNFIYYWNVWGSGVFAANSSSFYSAYNTTSTYINWTSAGSSTIYVEFNDEYYNEYYYTYEFYVTVSSAPSPPPTPTIQSTNCGNTVLARANPPSGVTYYWQSSSGGTSTSNSASTITKTSSGTQYLRARNSSGTWSTTSSYKAYTVTQATTWYYDGDGDGLGDPSVTTQACSQPANYVSNSNDTRPLSNENFIYTLSPRIGTTNISSLTNGQKVESVTYFDGLGRPMQSVGILAGGNSQDIITHIEYDQYGRQDKEYLPYSATAGIGTYRTGAQAATKSFYDQTKYDADFPGMNTTTINPYSEKSFEASPLNRILEQGAPGKDWLVNTASNADHTIKFESKGNTATEVRLYGVSHSYANNTFTPTLTGGTGYYEAGELFKTITRDENWTSGTNHTTEEFKDKQGRVVLKRTYNNGAHDTYYVYDDYGNLTYVLPPKAEPHTAKPDATELAELCYQYKYDHRNRLVEKKVPGKDWEYIVYNKLDQPVMTQDGNQRPLKQWLFTKYDAFGRVAYTGLHTQSSIISRTTMQGYADNTSTYTQFVTKTSSANTLAGTPVYYTNDAIPTGISEIHTINYYDDYTFDGFSSMPSTVEGQTVINYNNASGTRKLTKGLATGSKVRVLTTNDWITTYTGYDVKGNAIYTKSVNSYLGTTDIVQSKLDFTGAVEKATTTHSRSGHSTVTTVDTYAYDHMGRLLTHKNKINSLAEEMLASNTYDDLGQLSSKGVGNAASSGRLQTIDYAYNVRGWLKQINNPASLGSKLFAFKINYNTVDHSGTKLYNGNIAETEWRTSNDNVLRWYRYGYDPLNRITSATASSSNYNVSGIAYDKNGNITALTRQGHTNAGATSFGTMDNLVYTYETTSNKLKKVLDNGNDNYGFIDGSNITTEYTYDANGNMLRDYNKGITSNIGYNHLNLPTSVALSGGNISYIYDAVGTKLKKTVSTGTTVEYAGNYVYENGSLKFFGHPEGYVDVSGTTYKYVYQYKDHLGNIRLSYKNVGSTGSPSLQVQEENNYYPFGLKHKGYNGNIVSHHNWDFLGQERQEDLDLNWLTFRYRNYMPETGRFFGIDPVSEEYLTISTYQFAHNNPIWKIEIEGLEGEPFNKKADAVNQEPVKRTVTIVGQPTFIQDNRTPEQRAQAIKETPRRNAEYRERERQKTIGAPSERVGADRSKFIMEGVAIGMSFYGGEIAFAKLFQGAKLLTAAISSTAKVDETIVVVGQGMNRVKDAQSALLQNGAKSVEVFEPSAKAMKEWNTLVKGLKEGEHLSDEVVKGTKLFKENASWIKNVNNSGKTILDIGSNGSGKTSTFYEMEKSVIYGN